MTYVTDIANSKTVFNNKTIFSVLSFADSFILFTRRTNPTANMDVSNRLRIVVKEMKSALVREDNSESDASFV